MVAADIMTGKAEGNIDTVPDPGRALGARTPLAPRFL